MSGRNLIWMIVILALAGVAFYLSREKPHHVNPRDPVLDELSPVIEAYKDVRHNSYPELSVDDARKGLIEGLLRRVGNHSTYIPPGKVLPYAQLVNGKLEETGLRYTIRDGKVLVIGPLPGSPAQEAGLFSGEEIVAVNDQPLEGLEEEQVRQLLSPSRQQRLLLLLVDRAGKERTAELVSRCFDCRSVAGLVCDSQGRWDCDLGKGICYIRIREFAPHSVSELHEIYRGLDNPGGLILDLRDNPGGILDAAAGVADCFLQSGLIVRTVSRRGEMQARYARSEMTYPLLPMVVLIDGKTASAAEIVAGALRAHRRALLLGESSFGKWYVQTPFPLRDALGCISLTTAEWFLHEPEPPAPATAPASTTRAATLPTTAPAKRRPRPGLQPDVVLAVQPAQQERLELLRTQAMVLPPPGSPTSSAPTTRPADDKLKQAILETDAQLAAAAKLLQDQRVPATLPASPTTSGL